MYVRLSVLSHHFAFVPGNCSAWQLGTHVTRIQAPHACAHRHTQQLTLTRIQKRVSSYKDLGKQRPICDEHVCVCLCGRACACQSVYLCVFLYACLSGLRARVCVCLLNGVACIRQMWLPMTDSGPLRLTEFEGRPSVYSAAATTQRQLGRLLIGVRHTEQADGD